MQKDHVNEFSLGLSRDVSESNQQPGSYRFALNTVIESDSGDVNKKINENSTEICGNLHGYTLLGNVYLTGGEQLLFSVSPDDKFSEIGILDSNCNYTVILNDEDSLVQDRLGFKSSHQIEAVYRLRRGCERTIYFTDNLNKPRIFNLDKLDDYKINGFWRAKLFNLFRDTDKIPSFNAVEVLDSGGSILPGSYNIAIQYLDKGLNPTEWLVVSPTINIYNDLSSMEYINIEGSINSEEEYHNYGHTSKAIKVQLDNLDPTFSYYRLAFIAANVGSGLVNKVELTEVVSTTKDFYIYTGDNAVSTSTQEEILAFNDIVFKAKNITQLENRLLLSNTEGTPVNFCNLQRYASRIKADCIIKEVDATSIVDKSNTKNPLVHFGDGNGGVGYMPGEIYSFGIVYVFKDGSVSPVFHIAGKNHNTAGQIFSSGINTFPMSIVNQSLNTRYTSNPSCGVQGSWGLDSEGQTLKDKFVRHHRFPTRSEIGIPLVEEVGKGGTTQTVNYYNVRLSVYGELITPTPCDLSTDPECIEEEGNYFSLRVYYTVDGEEYSFVSSIDADTYANSTGVYDLDFYSTSQFHGSNNIVITKIDITDIDGNFVPLCTTACTNYTWSDTNIWTTSGTIKVEVGNFAHSVKGRRYKTNILGIKFSGVELPSLEDTNGEEIIGYYIVRNERTEFEKTIIDTGVLIPTMKNKDYISTGLLMPETDVVGEIEPTVWGLIHPEHKFNDKQYVTYDKMIHAGNFTIDERKYGKVTLDDVMEGTSYDGERDKGKSGNDDDGWSFDLITRDNILDFENTTGFIKQSSSQDFTERFYLDALETRSINDNAQEVYNLAADNKIGIVQFKDGVPYSNKLPYVILTKENADPYSNFRVLTYYKESVNMQEFDSSGNSTTSLFSGDAYVTPIRYVNTMFWDNRIAKRKARKNLIKSVFSWIMIAVGVLGAIFSLGQSLWLVGLGISIAATGTLLASSGIKVGNMTKAYLEEWEKGLRDTELDSWVDKFYNYRSTQPFGWAGQTKHISKHGRDGSNDDMIQWVGDCATDLWVESSINISLRLGMSEEVPTFLKAPGLVESGNNSPIVLWEFFKYYYQPEDPRHPISKLENHLVGKLLVFDGERESFKRILGVPFGEYYAINPDFQRYNKQKIYSHLPLEYECCTECREKFPHRIHYSEQSFQEELTDYFRIFLPNNYRDLDGNTGEITNTFTLGNNLFIHTEEGLWNMPRNYQERITDQIVSFIGTGSYFEVPPQKILDDETGNTAGLQHKWGATKTPFGYIFVTENQRKIYKFDGKQVHPISNLNLSNWFKNNIGVQLDADYKNATKDKFPYADNPSNSIGTGFISVYDSEKERYIFSKKDYILDEDITNGSDYKLVLHNKKVIVFLNISDTIATKAEDGWTYDSIVEDKLKFTREVIKTKTETRTTVYGQVLTVEVSYLETEYSYVEGVEFIDPIQYDNSWTISFSLRGGQQGEGAWISWHSYMPNYYFSMPDKFFSWVNGISSIWKHNKIGDYQVFYGKQHPFIFEYVSLSNPVTTRIWNHIRLQTSAQKYDSDLKSFTEERDTTFNKVVLYNSRQCSGELDLVVKNTQPNPEDYMLQQVVNTNTAESVIDKTEGDWIINDFRDIRVDYKKPIWDNKLSSVQSEYYIDKVLNQNTLDINKNWEELEVFKDKYLVIRFIFDNFADKESNTKLILNYTVENEQQSFS